MDTDGFRSTCYPVNTMHTCSFDKPSAILLQLLPLRSLLSTSALTERTYLRLNVFQQ